MRTIGSVLPLPSTDEVSGQSLWDFWTAGANWAAYSSARSALAALLADREVRRVWLPAYACPALMEGAIAGGRQAAWYAVDERLEPRLEDLQSMRSGDAVVGIDYFGRSPSEDFRALVRARPDVLWIEDRAQALAPGPAWGAVRLFSPRKLIGVGDGGLLVAETKLPQPSAPPSRTEAGAQAARAGDSDGQAPETWFPAFQAQEAAFAVDAAAMSPRTAQALRGCLAEPLIAARRRNAGCLAAALADIALWPEPPTWPPLAFPILVADAAAFVRGMAAQGVFCARHWADLPSPERFGPAHDLARRLVSLPCDHRYGEEDMARVVRAVRQVQAGAR